MTAQPRNFTQNDPYDRAATIKLVVPPLIPSADYMRQIRAFPVPPDAIALWFLGQNGFLLKDSSGLLVAVDLYLSNSCAAKYAHLPFRLDRQLPIFITPEDLDVDIFLTTHSHEDHADVETISNLKADGTLFLGPWDSLRIYDECNIPKSRQRLLHPGETFTHQGVQFQPTFAIPTDHLDLNHTGILITFSNGITFLNTGDTMYHERLAQLLPQAPDLCAIVINGGAHNLSASQAAAVVKAINPRVAIPCHYDMMVNNLGNPDMFRVALDLAQSTSQFQQLPYYEPWLYRKT